MSIELTSEQLAVVSSDESTLMVRAAAGSGKTRVLVQRYLKHVVDDGVSPDEILTVTFTKKAAAEMKRRIVDALNAAGRRDAAQLAETGPIQTLHGFCERLLRENSVAAGIDPDFEILDGSVAEQWRVDALRETLGTLDLGSEAAKAIVEKLAGKRTFSSDASPHGALEDAILKTIAALRGTSFTPDRVWTKHANPNELIRSVHESILAETEATVVAEFRAQTGPGFWSNIKAAYSKAKIAPPDYVPSPAVCANADLHELNIATETCGIVDLACRTWNALERRMETEQRFDFAYLEALAVSALEDNDEVARRAANRARVLLVDESQDLNPVQYRLLASVRSQIEMSVGDAQQSIYGFRQADVGLFVERSMQTPTLPLARNWRTEPPVLRVIDRLFGSLWPDYVPMSPDSERDGNFEGVELWVMSELNREQIAEWTSEIWEDVESKDIAILTSANAHGAELQARLEMLGVPSRVAGGGRAYYTRMEVRDLANVLQALTDPLDDLSTLAALRSPLVELSLDAVTVLASKAPVQGAVPTVELESEADREKLAAFWSWFEPLSKYADRLAAWEALTEVFTLSPYLANVASRPNAMQTLANVRKLLSLAAERPEMNARDFAETIRRIQRLKHKEGEAPSVDESEPAVTLMTVHKSKGLEFDAVIVTSTFDKGSKKADSVEVHRGLGLVATKFGVEPSPVLTWIARERQRLEQEEELRKLYVAMTRAKKRLCVVVSDKVGGKLLANRIWTTLDPDANPMPRLIVRRPSQDADSD